MAKKKLTEQEEKEIKMLQATNEMYEKTLENVKLRGDEEMVKRVQLAKNDIVAQIKQIDGSSLKTNNKNEENSVSDILNNRYNDNESIEEILDRNSFNESFKIKENINDISVNTTINNVNDVIISNNDFNSIDDDMNYDIISLPSNGQCYRHKTERLPVGYLTAYDENFITSPNLYKDGLIIDFLLKHKVKNNNIKLDELVSGDVDAIILFLRATSYGAEFPIVVRDPESGEQIETTIDLMSLKYKEFKLVGDENGYFDYELPQSKDKIKFKFLTRNDEKKLRLLSSLESDSVKARTIIDNISVIIEGIKVDKGLSGKDKQEYVNSLNKINEWAKKELEKNNMPFNRMITNRLELSIVSVNGETDRKYISKYVKNMNAKDSLMLRRYILENEPGVNFEIEIERPLSLGGGSFKTFLEWDDSVFLNIA